MTVGHRRWARLVAAGSVLCAAVAPNDAREPASNFRLYCMGCHGADGGGVPQRGVPDLRVEVARFLAVPGGRAYLSQVPGVLQSPLDDGAIARLLNWVVRTMASAGGTGAFEPYTAAEVARYRRQAPPNVMVERARLTALAAKRSAPAAGATR